MTTPNMEQELNIPFRHRVIKANILSGQQISEILDFNGLVLLAIQMPSAFTSTAITFNNGGGSDTITGPIVFPYHNVLGTEVSIVVAPGTYIGIAAIDMAPCRFLQLKTDVAEAADRVIDLICRSV